MRVLAPSLRRSMFNILCVPHVKIKAIVNRQSQVGNQCDREL